MNKRDKIIEKIINGVTSVISICIIAFTITIIVLSSVKVDIKQETKTYTDISLTIGHISFIHRIDKD